MPATKVIFLTAASGSWVVPQSPDKWRRRRRWWRQENRDLLRIPNVGMSKGTLVSNQGNGKRVKQRGIDIALKVISE
jgi:hypothetical protein